MKNLPNDISRCLGNHCGYKLKQSCKHWIENDKSECKILPISDFKPIQEENGNWSCEHKISRK